jgi:flagellar basal body-associated protein FliL
MSISQKQVSEPDDSSRKIVIIVAVLAAIVLAALFYFLMRASSGPSRANPTLQGAIRAGSPEWNEFAPKIVLDAPEATEAKRALGDIVMNLQTTARNFTGRTLAGLEVKGSVVNRAGQPIREQIVIAIPGAQIQELEPNRTMLVQVRLDGMTDADERANIKMEITGFKFK